VPLCIIELHLAVYVVEQGPFGSVVSITAYEYQEERLEMERDNIGLRSDHPHRRFIPQSVKLDFLFCSNH
jgi:hypothetical protein